MTFLGVLLVGIGVLVLYAQIRNLSVTCLLTNTLQNKTGSCANA